MTLEEVKKKFPINSIGLVGNHPIKITGYYFDTYNWWPINVVEGFSEENKTIQKVKQVCKNCPNGELVQVDSLIWMVRCKKDGTLMSMEEECTNEN